MKPPTNPGALVDRAGIREILGVTKARVHQMTSEPGFPAPFDVPNARNPIWLRAKVEEFDRARQAKSPSTTTPCDECGADIPDGEPSHINADHEESCTLHP